MIDTHLHVWSRARSPYRWLDTAPEPLRADHSLEEGLAAVAPFGFERAVLVQADETLDETAYLLELAAADPRVVGAVCYLPLESPTTVAEELPALTANADFVGVRNLTHDRPDPDWLLGDDQRRSLALLEASGVPLDYIAVSPRHLENLVTLAVANPGLTIVLDHLGTPPIGLDDEFPRWADQIAEVSSQPNVVAKASGIYPPGPAGIGASVTTARMQEILAIALASFGPERVMLGSDWPMGTVSGGTAAALSPLVAAVDALAPDRAHALRHGTAARVYGLFSDEAGARTRPRLLGRAAEQPAADRRDRCRGIARDAHLPAYRKARLPVAAVVDLDDQRARDLAAAFDVPTTYTEIAAAVAVHGTRAVYDVAVMPDAFASILEALPDGAAVQLQKPLGYTYAQARALLEIIDRKRLTAAVNTQLRFAPHVAAARTLIAEGAIGELVDIEVLVRVETRWELFPSVFGLERMEMPMHSVHYVDLVRSFVGDPSGVSAVTVAHPGTRLSSTRTAYLLHYAGRPLRVTISTNHDHTFGPEHQESAIVWQGTEGAIRAQLGLLLDYPRGGPDRLELSTGDGWRDVEVQGTWFPDAFIGTMWVLQRYISGESRTLPTAAHDVLRTMAVLEAAHEASQAGGHPLPEL